MGGNLLIERKREQNRDQRCLKAFLTELEFNLQLLGSIKAGELHYTKLEELVEFSCYELARDSGALSILPFGDLMQITSARIDLLVFSELAKKNPSLPFPEETSVGGGFNLEKYLSNAHKRLLRVSDKLREQLKLEQRRRPLSFAVLT